MNTQAVVDLTQSLGWIINQEKSELKPTQVFSFVGYKYHLDSALVKPTQERWLRLQDLNLRLKSKHVLTPRCLMSLIGLLASTEKMVPEGRLHMRPFQFHLKEHWRYPQLLDSFLPWTETISAHLEWWQNPPKMMKGADLHPVVSNSLQMPQIEGWGAHLEQTSTKGLWSDWEKATHKCSGVEGGFSGPSKFQEPVSKPKSVGCNRQFNSNGLHKQTRRNSLSRDVRCPVEDYDLVPSLPDNLESQTHSRVSECDGQHSVQVEPSAVNRMVTASTGVQTDMSKVVYPTCRSICHLSEPQTSTVCVSSPRPKCLGHRCSKHNLVESHCLYYPPTVLLHKVIQKIRQCNCLIIVISLGWPGIPWFWDLVQLSTEIPLQLPVSTTLLKQSHNYVFNSNPQHLNLHAWCLGVDSSKNKAFLWRWQRELLPLKGHQEGPSTSQCGPYLRNGAEKIRWISPLPL